MNIKQLPEHMAVHVKNRVKELKASIDKKRLTLPKNKLSIDELEQVMFFSEFAASTLIKDPSILVDLVESGDLERSYNDDEYNLKLELQIKNVKDDMELKSALGRTREREMVRIAWQDLTAKATLEQTLKDLSDLAEACVDKAISFIYDKLCFTYGTPLDSRGNVQKIIVLGMGKLGAGELNFSSDIDLIFAYPEDYLFEDEYRSNEDSEKASLEIEDTRLKKSRFNTTGEFFTKMCKNFLKVFDSSMSGTTLFRVDTRLRPFGANGPLAMSCYTMEEYYQTQGREWERYALIKARPIAGDIAAGYTLLKSLNPFVYRRYFDYGSFDALREMKKRISLQVRDKRFKNNIKLGAGGIREIEFFGQVFQLIRGGVEPEFQELKILKILKLLVNRNCIDTKTGDELAAAYCFLRKVENRLQQYNDLQTHDLPEKEDEKLRLAISMGFVEKDFYTVLNAHMARVHGHFINLLASESEEKPDFEIDDLKYIWQNISDPQFDSSGYKVSGFEDCAHLSHILKSLAEHTNTKKLTSSGRKRLDRLIPLLVHKIGQESKSLVCTDSNTATSDNNAAASESNTAASESTRTTSSSYHATSSGYIMGSNYGFNTETVLKRLVDLIITIERRTCYLSLLVEKPQALDNLVTLAARSPWIISFLSLHPALLDELLAPSTLYTPPDRAQMESEIERRMAHIPVEDFEFQLEELCIFKQVMTLRVAAADLSGNYPLMKVSDRLTEIAETVMNKVIEISWNHTVKKYGIPQNQNLSQKHGKRTKHDKRLDSCTDSSINAADTYSGKNASSFYADDEPEGSPLSSTYSASPCSQFFSPGFAAIAYGKLGGIELGYKSDLDMVFIYSGSDGYTEGGERSIENIRFYTLLGQRIISALTLHTQAGKLYEADMRLRPSGQSGMIVSHIDAFQDYIKNEAWTWEHQAIIRARPIGGDPAIQKLFNDIRQRTLGIKRETELLKKEVREMRERMRKEHLKSEPHMFDLKQGRGGIVDIEFLVQYLVLQHAYEHPALTVWTDNVRLLETLANENILTQEDCEHLKRVYLELRKMVHHLNLQEREKMIPVNSFKDQGDIIVQIFDKFLS
ncbi:MAG: bifunctional [glutamate--ammonia ligase]-adenylyl-L-tyrosine phosphorylase/[glutamate--ammonia-ligase] adenylyltransferase [Desulfamplus sp.]|nr:bifunctional [glutamate--ammonia ligase]-adenylyl-L-tyrosine phosphorylase/[glutamate--ammonia-ligase] adenylyltransferase [Desulfamplus sp.]